MTRRWLVAAVGATLLAAGAAGAFAAETDFFVDDADSVSLHVFVDRIGIVFPERVADPERQMIASALGGTITEEFPEGFTVLSLPDSMPRVELNLRVREARDSLQHFVTSIGLIVSGTDRYSPMILTDRFLVTTRPGTLEARMDSLNAHTGMIVRRRTRRGVGQDQVIRYLLEVHPDSSVDAIGASRQYARARMVDYATPDFVHVIYARSDPTGEPMYARQWHLSNSGQFGGTPDADIDANRAWDITMGSDDVVVAIIDGGYDVGHEEWNTEAEASLLWTNNGETCDGADTDGNGYVDDIHGWDYYQENCLECEGLESEADCSSDPNEFRCGNISLSCEGGMSQDDMHGTAVAGIVGAKGDNGLGGTGVAPGVSLMLLRRTTSESDIAAAFDYAADNGASVINCSWNLAVGQYFTNTVVQRIESAAESGRDGKGCIIVVAMTNDDVNDCGEVRGSERNILNVTWSEGAVDHDAVIAVSASNDLDQKVDCAGHGDCIDVLAPTNGGVLRIATTDQSGENGYNDLGGAPTAACGGDCPDPEGETTSDPSGFDPLAREPENVNYTYCFTGTSAAAPMVSGIAALVLSADPELTQPQVLNLIRDTADKIDDAPEEGVGADYDPATGFSAGSGDGSTHGWGRVNAYEAVRIAASASSGGQDGVDVFLRDNELDWGNTEQRSCVRMESPRGYISWRHSVDVKVDAGPDYASSEPTTSAEFDALEDEAPQRGETNRVYVRVRNRGPVTASSVVVKLHWARLLPPAWWLGPSGTFVYWRWPIRHLVPLFKSQFPLLPPDFWSQFPSDASKQDFWASLGTTTITDLVNSGSSAARTSTTDGAQIARFEFTPSDETPLLANRFAFLAIVDAGGADRPAPKLRAEAGGLLPFTDILVDVVTPGDNNITLKEFSLQE